MGRRKKIDGAVSHRVDADMFYKVENETPKCKVVIAEEAHHCSECGRIPRLHDIGFIDKEGHPKHFYMDCTCGKCNGEWYASREDAVESWNRENPSENRPLMPDGHRDQVDEFNDIFRGGINV